MSFFDELKRRNVVRVGIAYIVMAWVVLQVADVILGNIEAPNWIFQVILLSLAIGFPLVLLFAWAFELTPEGVKRDEDVDRSKYVARHTGRKLDFAIIGMLVLAVGYFAYDKFWPAPADKSIAVLPFVNMSDDKEQEYFSDGLSEELLNLLAKIPALRVIARTSSFAYKDQKVTIAEVARDLDVKHVLEGSVRKSGKCKSDNGQDRPCTVRITAQLIRAADESHEWSEAYDRPLDDVFAIQDEIAAAVVAQLKVKILGTVPTSEATDTEAYALYLRARELSHRSSAKGHREAIELYGKALEIDENYTAAWAGLAENYIFLADRSLLPIEEGFGNARKAAERALILDPTYAPAHASLGWIEMVYDHDLQAAARHLERALELEPANPDVIRAAAILSTNLLRLDEAIRLQEYAVSRDPVRSAVHSNLALSYFCAGRLNEALASYRTALRLSPDAEGLQSWIGETQLAKNPKDALASMMREPREEWRLIGLVMAHHALGQKDRSDAFLNEFIEKFGKERKLEDGTPAPRWPYQVAYVLAFRGEADRTFEWLEEAKRYNDPGLSEIATTPAFNNVKSDERWLPFLASVGKTPEQLAAIEFEVPRLSRR